MTAPHVRVRQDSFDFAHPCEKQVQVFARIPGLKPVSYLLPTDMWEQVRTTAWGGALDVAHEYYAANVWGDTAREAKDALRTWLASAENRLLLTDAWTADLIKRDPAVCSMVTQLTDERDRARRIAVALEQEVAELARARAEAPSSPAKFVVTINDRPLETAATEEQARTSAEAHAARYSIGSEIRWDEHGADEWRLKTRAPGRRRFAWSLYSVIRVPHAEQAAR